jgi:chromosome segregation ATPase
VLLEDMDLYRIRQFCYHWLTKRIFEIGWDDSGLIETYKKILNVCNRKGSSLNTRSGFQKAFAGKTGNAQLGPSQFKSILSGIAPSLLNSEFRTLEERFKGENGRIQLNAFIDELFALEGSSAVEYTKIRKESASTPTHQKSIKGKLEEVKKENETLKRENIALLEEVNKLKKTIANSKTTFGKAMDMSCKGTHISSNEDSRRILELEKNNYELLKKIDTDLKPQIERYRASIESLKSEIKVLKLENLKYQSQVEKLLKKPMDGVEKKHELDYMRENKIVEQEKKIAQLVDELHKLEQKSFDLQQSKQELQYEKENFALERARLERRIKDLEHFLAETK